jgi:predicted amidohydrolase YtcJ
MGRYLALVNGVVHADGGPAASALLIREPVIEAIGETSDILAQAPPGTRVVDLAGRHVMPAFTDSHTHYHRAAVLRMHFLDFTALAPRSLSDVLAAVRGADAVVAPGQWVQGDNLSAAALAEARLPTRAELDHACPGRPVILRTVGKHGISANSAALAAAGITAATPDPPGGRIERDAAGEPAGVLHETAKLRLDALRADTVVPPLSEQARLDALRQGLRELARHGITEIHEITQSPDELADYARLREAGDLTARVVGYVRVVEGQATVDDLLRVGMRTGFGDDWLRLGGIKVSIDGSCTMHNALLYQGYLDEPGNTGLIRVPAGDLDDIVARAERGGLQVALHAIGQRAVDLAADAIDRAQGGRPSRLRHRVEHAYLAPRAGQLERLRDLGVTVSTQPSFLWANGDTWAAMFGPGETERMMPVRALLDLGIPAMANTDFPNAPLDPAVTLRAAVERRTRAGAVIGAAEAVTPRTAWSLVTTGAAYGAFEERTRGKVAPGYLADLVVLSADPFDPGALGPGAVDATVAGGRPVHAAGALAGWAAEAPAGPVPATGPATVPADKAGVTAG